jgi:hypothetical protein
MCRAANLQIYSNDVYDLFLLVTLTYCYYNYSSSLVERVLESTDLSSRTVSLTVR